MSFVTQDDVFEAIEPVLAGVFEEFANGKSGDARPASSRASPISEAMLKYGSDKPDLRNPILISDVSDHFQGSGFGLFARIVEGGGVVRAIPAPGTAEKSRKFFDDMNDWARSEGHAGLGYITQKGGELGGPIAKNHGEEATRKLIADARPRPRRRHLLRRRQGGAGGQAGRRGAHPRRRGARPDRRRRLQILLDRRFPDVRI